MSTNPVIVSDIADRWRPLTDAETIVAESLLSDAWAVVLARYPTVPARLLAGTLAPSLVTAVIAAMVLRVMRNPEGKRSEAIDDYSWTRDPGVAGGYLYLSDDELALLAPVGADTGAWTIRPGNTTWDTTTVWVDE